jgi:hypothetical protein
MDSRPLSVLGAAIGALTVATPASGAPAKAVYGGTAATPGNSAPFVIKTKGNRITEVVLRWETDCTSGYRFVFKGPFKYAGPMPKGNGIPGGSLTIGHSRLFANPIAKNGKFTAELFGSVDIGSTSQIATETTKISGTLRKSGGAGVYTAQTVIAPFFTGPPPSDFTPDICDAGRWKWSATRGPGVFGGATQQGAPVVVLYNAKKRLVTDYLFGWRADGCGGPDTWFDFADAAKNFPVDNDGQFGDAFTYPEPGQNGVTTTYAYGIQGFLNGKRMHGSFDVSASMRDASGSLTGSCSTPGGGVAWSAASA